MLIVLVIHAKSHSFSFSYSGSMNHSTATNQFSFLNVIPMSFILTSSKSSVRRVQSSTLIILLGLLLSGDIQLNPGPASNTFNVCTLNIRSLLNPMKYTAIFDLAHLVMLTCLPSQKPGLPLLPHLLNYAMQPLPASLWLAVHVQHLLI